MAPPSKQSQDLTPTTSNDRPATSADKSALPSRVNNNELPSPPASASAPPDVNLQLQDEDAVYACCLPQLTNQSSPGEANLIPIFVETLTGVTFEMQITPQETVLQVKQKLEHAEGINVAQQHLLWQGQELRDTFTLEDYNVGFGAILKLVLGLRVGPINQSHALAWSQLNDDSDLDVHDDESRPLTVLVFRDGDHIRLLTISTTRSQMTTAATETGTSEGQRSNCCTQRRLENESMRNKMQELQGRMEALSLRRHTATKLPKLSKSRSRSDKKQSQEKRSEKASTVCLPPLVTFKTNQPQLVVFDDGDAGRARDDKSADESAAHNATGEEDKHELKVNAASKARLSSLGNEEDAELRATHKQYNDRLFYKLSTCSGSAAVDRSVRLVNDTSSVGSVGSVSQRAEMLQRPRTSPMVGNVSGLRDMLEVDVKITTDEDTRMGSGQKGKLNDAVKAVNNKMASSRPAALLRRRAMKQTTVDSSAVQRKKSAKPRCALSECRKRLPIAGRFVCRCSMTFCNRHRYSESHQCKFDYKTSGRFAIESANPVIRAPKLPKI